MSVTIRTADASGMSFVAKHNPVVRRSTGVHEIPSGSYEELSARDECWDRVFPTSIAPRPSNEGHRTGFLGIVRVRSTEDFKPIRVDRGRHDRRGGACSLSVMRSVGLGTR